MEAPAGVLDGAVVMSSGDLKFLVTEVWRVYYLTRNEVEAVCAAIGIVEGEGRTLAHRCGRLVTLLEAFERTLLALDDVVFSEKT